PPAPTWEDFNALSNRLQATEARLQALANSAPTGDTTYETSLPQPPRDHTPLSSVTQTPESMPDILARLANVERSLQAQGNKVPLVRITRFAQLDQGVFSQTAQSRANLGDIQDGVGFRRARLQA